MPSRKSVKKFQCFLTEPLNSSNQCYFVPCFKENLFSASSMGYKNLKAYIHTKSDYLTIFKLVWRFFRAWLTSGITDVLIEKNNFLFFDLRVKEILKFFLFKIWSPKVLVKIFTGHLSSVLQTLKINMT